jgi:hypothetical protein
MSRNRKRKLRRIVGTIRKRDAGKRWEGDGVFHTAFPLAIRVGSPKLTVRRRRINDFLRSRSGPAGVAGWGGRAARRERPDCQGDDLAKSPFMM